MAIFNSFLYVYQRVLFNTIQRYERYDLWPDPPRKGFEDAKGWDGERVTSLEELLWLSIIVEILGPVYDR